MTEQEAENIEAMGMVEQGLQELKRWALKLYRENRALKEENAKLKIRAIDEQALPSH